MANVNLRFEMCMICPHVKYVGKVDQLPYMEYHSIDMETARATWVWRELTASKREAPRAYLLSVTIYFFLNSSSLPSSHVVRTSLPVQTSHYPITSI
jgi:hypothetical protein